MSNTPVIAQADPNAVLVLPDSFKQGLTAIAICSSISLFTTSTLLIFLAYKAIREYQVSRGQTSALSALRGTYSIHTQGYFWLVNLFIADFVQSLGLFLVTNHLVLDSVMPGAVCTLQGFLINSGDIASAIWSFVIAFHTFFLLAGGRQWRTWVAEKSTSGKARWCLCIGIWLFVLFIGVIGLIVIEKVTKKGPFYDQAGAGWCWINASYFWERIFFHYIFLFIDMFALTILYCVLFFYIRIQLKSFRKAASSSENQSAHELQAWQANLEAGKVAPPIAPQQILTTKTVTVTTEVRPQLRKVRSEADRAHKRMNQVALTLLCYPIMYICLTMPISITRISEFAGNHWGLTSIYVAACIYCCSGFVNVLLYTATRKGIISWDWLFRRRRSRNSTAESVPPPPYNPHYPGTHHGPSHSESSLHIPTVTSKPSAASLGHQNPPTPPKSSAGSDRIGTESDAGSLFATQEYDNFHNPTTSDGDKLVHSRTCIFNCFEDATIRTSNASTLIGSCNCGAVPKTPTITT